MIGLVLSNARIITLDVSIFLVLLKFCVWWSSHLKAFLEFISCFSFSVFLLNDGSLLTSCSFSLHLVVGLGNSLMVFVSFLYCSTPSLLIVLPAYRTLSHVMMLSCVMLRLMLLHL